MEKKIIQIIVRELNINEQNILNSLELLQEGATIPFVARYRKEKTGSLDEVQLRDIWERFNYLTEIENRKQVILESIKTQNKLTKELEEKISVCWQKNELEDLYLPFKPKRRTRATIAKEKNLESLAEKIQALNHPQTKFVDLNAEASKYIDADKGVLSVEDALNGAADILAETIAEKAEIRSYLREYLFNTGVFIARIKSDYPEGTTKFEMYRDYQIKVNKIAPHNFLALLRGETEGILTLNLGYEETEIFTYLERKEIHTKLTSLREFYSSMLKDSFKRLLEPSLIREIRSDRKVWADIESIKTFEANLRELLLASPAGMKPTLAIDPGFRTGCKMVILSETGKFLEYQTIFPHNGEQKRQEAAIKLKNLIEKYQIQLIAIGNGTASRETDEFVGEVNKNIQQKTIKVIVNESGASIYSASEIAREEFPDLDVTVRGAISIGRRLQDPLAELVKIEPKSIGVGQYQHDVEQKLLKQKLEETVSSCVNYVGVDLNTASKQLLNFVSGITPTIANNIVAYRDAHGAFKKRQDLLKVPKLGPKAFEQAAGFLKITNGENPLDNTSVHPESYPVVETILSSLQVPLSKSSEISTRLKSLNLQQFVTEKIGLPTLKDIVQELEKPGRDPRAEFKYATFQEHIKEVSDLKEGMVLEGIITNVVNFGAFIDIGVHQDGLIHISQLCDRFVKDPQEIVKVGQVVKVKVLEVNVQLKRINLSMKSV